MRSIQPGETVREKASTALRTGLARWEPVAATTSKPCFEEQRQHPLVRDYASGRAGGDRW